LNSIYYHSRDEDLSSFEQLIKIILDKKLLKNKGIFIQSKGATNLYIRGETAWKEAEKTDYVELKDVLQQKIATTIPNLNTILGFIIEFKKSYFVFKTKNLKLKRHRGARCDQARKNDTIKTLVTITDSVTVTNNNNEIINKESLFEEMNNIELCAFMEFLLRYYQQENMENKAWFIEPEFSQLLKIEEYSLK